MSSPLPGAARAPGAAPKTAPATSVPATSAPKSGIALFYEKLMARRATWATSLPKHVPVDRFIKSIMIAVAKTPGILSCTEQSLMQCLHTGANLGLDFSGWNNASHLIPFKNKKAGTTTCTMIVGYRDLLGLVRRSGQVKGIHAFIIHEGDDVTVHYGTEPRIEHKPAWSNPGKMLGVYATATLDDGEKVFTPIMSVAEIERIRNASQSYRMAKQYGGSSPWDEHFEQMSIKTGLRRLSKMLPMATEEIARALEADDRGEAGEAPKFKGTKEIFGESGDTLDVEGFARVVEDGREEEESAGAPGAVDEALDRVGASAAPAAPPAREPGDDEPEAFASQPTPRAEAPRPAPAAPAEDFRDIARRAAGKAAP